MEDFQGKSFHSARWDYEYTGGSPDGNLTNLADKVVGVIGTGASAIQCVPPLAESAKHLYVFQRTPSAIGVRGNRPTARGLRETLHPGWQQERMENFTAIMIGRPVERDLIDDGWTHHMAKVANPAVSPEMSSEEIMQVVEEFDFAVMEEHRSRDRADSSPIRRSGRSSSRTTGTSASGRASTTSICLRSTGRTWTLVDCPAGIERVTEHGLVANGETYELDCIIYATGFEAELTPLPRRAGHPSSAAAASRSPRSGRTARAPCTAS